MIIGNLPVITLHPENISIILTNTYTTIQLKCEAVGASSYEWQTRSGKSLTGVTGWKTSVLTLYNVSISDNDDYQCVATNASGSSFSYYATLDINGMYVMIPLSLANGCVFYHIHN